MYDKERRIEPDLVIQDGDKFYIFDVKYKNFNLQNGVNRNDLFQLHTYIGQYSNYKKVCGCGFIYPISEEKYNRINSTLISSTITQNNNMIPFHIVFLKIPNENNKFLEEMNLSCDNFIEIFKEKIII